jgi:pilus assembly protein CpaB
MRSRGLVITIAFVLAAIATMVVYLYLLGVQREGNDNQMVSVVVSERNIPAGTDFDNLIGQGAFDTRSVPRSALVSGAVLNLSDLRNQESSAAIAAGEQITTARLRGNTQLPGGSLGIPDGYQALTLPLEAPRLAGGSIERGDRITIYGTFTNMSSATGNSPPATVTLVPQVEVLKVAGTAEDTGTRDYWVTLALKAKDAQKVVFAQEQGSVWLSLLPPNQKGTKVPPVGAVQLLR